MVVPYENLHWRETQPGVWVRAIDEIEHSYSSLARLYEGSGRMFFGMTGHLSVAVDVEGTSTAEAEKRYISALQKAWLALRFSLPTIGARTVQDYETGEFTKTYKVWKGDPDKEKWLRDTFVMISTGETGVEWANKDPPAPVFPTLFIINPGKSKYGHSIQRDLVLRSPHDIIDGIGTLQLFNVYMEHFSKAYDEGDCFQTPEVDGSEVSRLSPPYRIAAEVPEVLTELHMKKLSEYAKQKVEVAQSTGNVVVMSVPYRQGATLPGVHKRTELTFSGEETAQLTTACQNLGITITHAFHTAGAMVMRDLQEPQPDIKTGRYINYILKNERASCMYPYNTPQHATGVYHSVSGYSLVVDMRLPTQNDNADSIKESRKQEFSRIVNQMRDFYDNVRKDQDHSALAPTIFGTGRPQLPMPYDQVPTVPLPALSPSVSLSSMGRIDNIIKPAHGSIQVYNPWVTGEELRSGLGLFLGTFRGQLCLSAAYNDAWHGEGELVDYLQRCRRIVMHGLGIEK
jgi:hypothetical protein